MLTNRSFAAKFLDSDRKHPLLNVLCEEAVGEKANKFISFTYSDNFIDLVGALKQWLITRPEFCEESTYC